MGTQGIGCTAFIDVVNIPGQPKVARSGPLLIFRTLSFEYHYDGLLRPRYAKAFPRLPN